MAPFKSTGGLSVGKLLGSFRNRDLTLNSSVRTNRFADILGTIDNPAINAQGLVNDGQTANGYYYIQGNGGRSARQIYCILDSGFQFGAGWMLIANHDGAKEQDAGHQPRPTGYTSHVGSDNGSGNPATSDMVPQYSFSVDSYDIPFTTFCHMVYASSNMTSISASNILTPLGYYAGSFNSNQTIPNTSTWSLEFDNKGLTLNSFARRLYNGISNTYQVGGVGVFNDLNGPNPRTTGNGATAANYPVYIGSYIYSVSGTSENFSFTDASSSNGWDDFQDGSGMSDSWSIENVGNNAYRGNPSCILIK
jgi:hypothetical protein